MYGSEGGCITLLYQNWENAFLASRIYLTETSNHVQNVAANKQFAIDKDSSCIKQHIIERIDTPHDGCEFQMRSGMEKAGKYKNLWMSIILKSKTFERDM